MPTFVEHSNQELRQALAQTTRTPSEQISQVEALRSTHQHSISLVPWSGELSFNCVQYALDLVDLPNEIRCKIDELDNQGVAPRIWPLDTPFVNFLINSDDLQELDRASHGNLIAYLDAKGRVRHCGKIVGGVVHSKWGHRGCLWQHRIEEVPSTYGFPKYFQSVSTDQIIPRLLVFMEEIRWADTPRKRNCLLESLNATGYSRGI